MAVPFTPIQVLQKDVIGHGVAEEDEQSEVLAGDAVGVGDAVVAGEVGG